MRKARLDESQAGTKVAGRNINNLRYADDTTLMAESEEKLKSLLMRVKGEREKTGLKPNIQKTKIMASDLITSWQNDEEKMEIVTDFIFLDSKSLQTVTTTMKLRLLPLKESYDIPRQHIKKQRHHFADKGPYSQSYGFPPVMYRCEI